MFDIQKTKQNKKEPKIVEINVYNITLSILCWDKGLFLPVFFICLFFFLLDSWGMACELIWFSTVGDL